MGAQDHHNSDPAIGSPASLPLDPSLLRTYQSLRNNVLNFPWQQTEGILLAEVSALERVRADRRRDEQRIADLRSIIKRQSKKLQKLESGWSFSRIHSKARKEQKTATYLARLEEARTNAVSVTRSIEGLRATEKRLEASVSDVQRKLSEAHTWRQSESDLVISFFERNGPLESFDAHEAQLRGLVAQNQQTADVLKQHFSAYSKASNLLQSAQVKLRRSAQYLESASNLATYDIVNDVFSPGVGQGFGLFGGINSGVDVYKRIQIKNGNALAHEAAQEIDIARRTVPEASGITLPKLEEFGLGFVDVVFDNIITDVLVKRSIQKNLKTVRELLLAASGASWTVESLLRQRIQPDLQQATDLLACNIAQLDKHRRWLLGTAVEPAIAIATVQNSLN